MDWSKAKTILIVAFLVTNILLVAVLLSSQRQVETTTKEGFIEDVTRLLNNKNIFIDTEMPKEIPSLNILTVEYEMLDSYEANRKYFNGKGKIESKDKGTTGIIYNDEYILITNKKILSYENKKQENKYKNLNNELAKTIAIKFLEERNYDTSDMLLSCIKNEGDTYYLEFSKIYKDKYLEKANTTMEIDSRGVRKLDRIWLKVLNEGETPIYISTAPKAILSLLGKEEVYGKTIKDISLCYYFGPMEQKYVKEPNDPRKGNTFPAWRVLFDDGYKIIIDNY
ncbi:two-component system regulatory protein YycI [Tissierella praeacuta]|uniref:two-component system regulatory protein YycI n=1 Tax=Tissierella praeacuta TaxID=43131 RepID=UPI0028A9AF1D|nr:two-component system regulatory protein YycI [Tissierella praeacuta]